MDFYEMEETDGVRLPWNVLPVNRAWAEKVVLPIGIHYTPLKQIGELEFLGDHPVYCQSCKAILNPFCSVEANSKSFKCPICGARSSLPQAKLKQLAEQGAVAETRPQNSTIEYLIDEHPRERGLIFLVDKCVAEDELQEVKASVLAAVQTLSDDTCVALVTFDRNVFVQDLEETDFLAELSLNGSKDYDLPAIAKMLHFALPNPQAANHSPSDRLTALFRPLEQCRQVFERAVEKLRADRWPQVSSERPLRAFGAALKVCLAMASGWFIHVPSSHPGRPDRRVSRRRLHLRPRPDHPAVQRNLHAVPRRPPRTR